MTLAELKKKAAEQQKAWDERSTASPKATSPDPVLAPEKFTRSTDSWVSNGGGRKSRTSFAPKTDLQTEMSRLEELRRQAAVDLDVDTVNALDKRMKELRASMGEQTFGDRASDVLSNIMSGTGAGVTNVAGFAANMFEDVESYKTTINHYQNMLTTGRGPNGTELTPDAKQALRDSIEELQQKVKDAESPNSLHNRIYKAADTMADDSAQYMTQAKEGLGKVGTTVVDAASAFGQSMLTNSVGALTGTGMLPFVVSAFGSAAQDARRKGATLEEQLTVGGAQAAKEYVTEKLFGLAVPQKIAGAAGSFDDVIQKGIRGVTERLAKTANGQQVLGGVLTWLAGGATEALEEGIGAVIEDTLINPHLKQGFDPDTRTRGQKFEDALYNMLVGGVSGLLGVTNLMGYNPGESRVDTTEPQSYNEPVSPAAAPQVQQMEQQAEITRTEDPESDVLSAAVTLFTQQGMKLKTAQQKAEVVERLVAGKEVSTKEINKLEPTNKKSQALFTQLTGVQFPEGRLSIEQLYNLYRSANTVAQETRSAQEQVAEAAVAAEPAQTETGVVEHQDLDSNGNPVATFEEFLSHYQKQFPDGTQEDAAQMYEAYLYEHATVSYRGRRVSRDKFKEAMRQAPGGQQLTEQEMDAIFDDELNRQREDGKDATEHSVRNEEEAYGQQGPDPVHSSGLQGQPGEHPGEYGGGVSGGAGAVESQSAQGDGYAQDEHRGDAGVGSRVSGVSEESRVNIDTPVRESVASDGRTHFMELARNAWDETLAAKEPAFARAGVSLRAAVDAIPIPGSRRTCDGVSLLGVESIVQTNSPYFTGEQLCDHEVLHQYFFRDKSLHTRCSQAYFAQVDPDVRNRLFDAYVAKYGSVYKAADKGKKKQIKAAIYEEIICDAYAGMNRDGAGADQIQNVIKPLVDEWCAERDAEMLEAEKKYSIDSMTEAIGLTFEKDGQLTVFKDAKGNRVDEVTEDMIRQSPFGAVLNASVTGKLITQEDADQQVKFFKGLYNLMLNTQDIDLLWAVSATLGFQPLESGVRDASTLNQKSRFAGYTKNSDPQYSTTVDFTTICVKTQAVIDAMSETMVRLGHGLTEQEIVEIVYKNTHEAGEPVPCPVCYVFSRWVGLGGLFDRMNQLQIQYANVDEDVLRQDIETLEDRIYEIMVEREYEIKRDKKSGKPKINGKAREAMYKELVNRQNELQAKQNQELVSGKKILTAAETAELETVKKQVGILDNWTWLRDVRLSESYEPVPAEILFDINAGKAFAEQYPESWKFRTTRGPAMGKAATPYADEHLGQILRGAGVSDLNKAELGDPAKNPFLKSKNGKLTKAAEKTLRTSRSKIKAQNLLNGQRYQSTSDFRFEYALDYLMSFVEMQALGAKVQLYTKVAESVRMFASVGAEVNCSLMPLGVGYRTNKDGSKTLVFSSVTGMNDEDAFNLSNEFDNVQPIMVGVDNTHIKLCLADERISFVIPYHASGASEGRYVALMDIVGESVAERTDYSNYQTDHRVEEPTEAQTAAYDLRLRLLTGKLGLLNDADKAVLKSNDILHNLYKRFYGQDADGNRSDIDLKYLNPEVRNSGKLFHDPECAGVFLTSEQAKTVMPFEYWDRTSTLETADLNGQAFVDYCESLGLHPRFSGWDAKGAYHADMDFSKESGYWKMLIDRRCYNRDGSYHEQQPINVTNFDAGFLLRDEAIKGIVQPSLVNDPAKTAKIAEKSVTEVQERRGEAKYSVVGWKPRLDNTEWSIVESVMDNGRGAQLTEVDKMFFEKSKGRTVFGIYSTDDSTLLYASHGEDAVREQQFVEFVKEEYNNGRLVDTSTKGIRALAERARMQSVGNSGNNVEARGSDRFGEDAGLHGGQPRFYASAALENVLANLLKAEDSRRANGVTEQPAQASEKSGAFDLPEAKYSITPEFEQWYRDTYGREVKGGAEVKRRLQKTEARAKAAEFKGVLDKGETERAWEMHHKKELREQKREFDAKLEAARKAKTLAVRDAVAETKEVERAKAAVQRDADREKANARVAALREAKTRAVRDARIEERIKADERVDAVRGREQSKAAAQHAADLDSKKRQHRKDNMAEALRSRESEMAMKRQAAKRLRTKEDAYQTKISDMKENAKLKRNAAKATLRNAKLAAKKRAAIETEQGPVNTIRQNPKERSAMEKRQAAAEALRTLGRSAYRNFVNMAEAIDRFSKRQASGVRAGTLVNIVGGTSATVENIFKRGLVNRAGDQIGGSMSEVFLCWDGKKVNEEQQALLQDYMLHAHNVDRMSFVAKAEAALSAFEDTNPWLRDMDTKEFARLTAMTEKELEKNGQHEAHAKAIEYARLLRRRNEAQNKPIFADENGNDVTADTSREICEKYLAENPWLEEKAQGIYEWWDLFMRTWAVGDTITEAEYEAMHATYPHYVPTYRTDKGGVGGANFVGMGAASVSKAVKRAKGGHSEVMNIEDSFTQIVSKIVRMNRVNELYMNIIDTAMLDDAGNFADMAYFDWDWQDGAYANALITGSANITDLTDTVDAAEKAGLEKVGQDYKLTAWLNGRKYTAYISEDLYKSIGMVTGQLANDLEKGLLKAGNLLTGPMKTAITGINLSFAFRNMFRDLPTAMTNSMSGLAFPKYWARAAQEMTHNSENWQRFKALGGTHATYYNDSKGFAHGMASRDIGKNVLSTVGWFNEVTEAQTRFAEYLATVDRLGDTYDARLQGIKNAAEVTVDFSRKGRYGKVINAWVPYWNPAVQGIDKTVRSVIESPDGSAIWKQAVKTVGRASVTTVLFEAVLFGVLKALDRDDEWEQLSDRTKDTYYCIPLKNSHTFLKIPKNREWGAILGTPFMRMLEYANGRENPFENYLETAIEPNFLPPAIFRPDAGGGFATDVIGFSQMNDLSKNEDFAGRTIVPYAYQQGSLSQQYDAETSWLSKQLGALFNWSPMQIDYIIEDYFGDFGDIYTMATSEAVWSGEQNAAESVLDLVSSPWTADARYSNQAVSDYYDLLDNLGKVVQDKKNQLGNEKYKETVEYQTQKALTTMYGNDITELNARVRDLPDGVEKDNAKAQIAQLARAAEQYYEDCMTGKIHKPILDAEYADFSGFVADELIRMDGYSADYKFTPTGNPSASYTDPANKSREYILTDEQKDYFKQLYREQYDEIFGVLIQSQKYRSAKDSKKAEYLADTRDDVLDATKDLFFDWLKTTGVRSTPKKK